MRTRKAGRLPIVLVCTVCGGRNYKTTRSRQPDNKPISLKKFCRTCDGHTLHLETA